MTIIIITIVIVTLWFRICISIWITYIYLVHKYGSINYYLFIDLFKSWNSQKYLHLILFSNSVSACRVFDVLLKYIHFVWAKCIFKIFIFFRKSFEIQAFNFSNKSQTDNSFTILDVDRKKKKVVCIFPGTRFDIPLTKNG